MSSMLSICPANILCYVMFVVQMEPVQKLAKFILMGSPWVPVRQR